MEPSADAFRALARSSPWRWRTLHFIHRDNRGSVEAWVRRPGALLVRTPDGDEHRVDGLPYTSTTITVRIPAGDGEDDGAGDVTPPAVVRLLPHEVQPPRRPDGLVAVRPSSALVDYDDPMWQNYSWVAMLDPVELSHHVRIEEPQEVQVLGRRAWRSVLVAEKGYQPRCGGNCCELLWSEAGLMADFSDDPSRVPESWRGRSYPEAYDVALDVQTGVVVRCLPIGGEHDAPWLENDVLDVDTDVDSHVD